MSKPPTAPPGAAPGPIPPSNSAASLGSRISETDILNFREGAGASDELSAEHALRLKSMVLTGAYARAVGEERKRAADEGV